MGRHSAGAWWIAANQYLSSFKPGRLTALATAARFNSKISTVTGGFDPGNLDAIHPVTFMARLKIYVNRTSKRRLYWPSVLGSDSWDTSSSLASEGQLSRRRTAPGQLLSRAWKVSYCGESPLESVYATINMSPAAESHSKRASVENSVKQPAEL